MTTGLGGPPILFLDLDGTVRHGRDELGRFVNGPEDVTVFPEAVERMREWRGSGGYVYGVTNQAGVALGHMTLQACLRANEQTDYQCRGQFERIAVCPHAPDAQCFCRKPLPGLLIDCVGEASQRWGEVARDRCLMVGDRPEDEQAAMAAGVPFQWAREWRAGAPLTP